MKKNNLISAALLLSASAMLAQTSKVDGSVFHTNINTAIGHTFLGGGGQQFNLSHIMHVRKNNQRNKNQKRIRGGALK